MNKPTPQDALNALYQASTLANLPKTEHDKLLELAKIIMEALEPKTSDSDHSETPKKKK